MKELCKDCNEQIFIAFAYLFTEFFLLWHKITKKEHTFKTHD